MRKERNKPKKIDNWFDKKPTLSVYFSPDKKVEDIIISFINLTFTTLDISIYSLTLDSVASAIKKAVERGVKVRICADRLQSAGRYSKIPELQIWVDEYTSLVLACIEDQDAVIELMEEKRRFETVKPFGINYALCNTIVYNTKRWLVERELPEIRIDHEKGILHNKYIISDNRAVLTGSTNFTKSGVKTNRENMILFRKKSNFKYAVDAYAENFEELWFANG